MTRFTKSSRALNLAMTILLGSCVFGLDLHAASPVACSGFSRSFSDQTLNFRQRAAEYARAVADSRGLRLILKPEAEDAPLNYSALGFLSLRPPVPTGHVRRYVSAILHFAQNQIGAWLARDSRYRLSIGLGVYNTALRIPTLYASSRIANNRLEPAFFFRTPAIIALSLALFAGGDSLYRSSLQNHIAVQAEASSDGFDRLIENDFRFHDIREALKLGIISPVVARQEALLIQTAYSQYFSYRNAEDIVPTEASEMKLINHYLFRHLKTVVENGVTAVPPGSGYLIPASAVGRLSGVQVLQLFANAHIRYIKYQLVEEMLRDTDLWHKLRESPSLHDVAGSIANDNFIIQLKQLKFQGRISPDQLIYRAQEYIYWQSRFADWKTIGVQRLRSTDGHFTDDILSINEVLTEIVSDAINDTAH